MVSQQVINQSLLIETDSLFLRNDGKRIHEVWSWTIMDYSVGSNQTLLP